MNILTDILSLIRQGKFSKVAEKDDVLVRGKWNETPDMTGVASPIPYKAVKLIKISDFKIEGKGCTNENTPLVAKGDTATVYQKTVNDPDTGECTVYFRTLKSLSSNLTLNLSSDDDYVEITTEGEPNTAANVGTGAGLWKNKVGETLNFKSLKPGSNISFTEAADEITISAASGGSTNFNTSADAGTNPVNIIEGNTVYIKGSTAITTTQFNNGFGSDITVALDDTTVNPGSYTNANITVDAQGRLTAADSGSAPYTSYVQLLSQNGENPPTGPILENTAGITITWTYNTSGQYIATYSTSLADINKTAVSLSQNTKTSSGGIIVNVTASFATGFNVTSVDTTGTGVNSQLLGAVLEIKIYP